MNIKKCVSWMLLSVFLCAFVMMIISMSVVCILAMLVSISAFFVNEWVCMSNQYEKRITEMNDRLNQHVLEHNMNAFRGL